MALLREGGADRTRRSIRGVGPAPGDGRGVVHKRIFGGIKGFLKGGPIGAVGGFLTPTARPALPPDPFIAARLAARQAQTTGAFDEAGFRAQFFGRTAAPAVPGRCPEGFIRIGPVCARSPFVPAGPPAAANGFLAPQTVFTNGQAPGPVGDAVMGRFGAGFQPEMFSSTTRRCGRGAVLGLDGICYNRRDLRNSERFWPRGRRPLLTGGEMRCINVASSAAKKLQRKQKQLQELGLLKPPARRAKAAQPAVHVRTAGVAHSVVPA